jgi:hypothetical protein
MQNFEQVKDVIEYSEIIHNRLQKIYGSLNEKERPEREKMLLDYLIEQQVRIKETLAYFELASQQSILDTWMQFTPNIDIQQLIDDQEPQSEISFEEIVQFADSSSQALVDFYHEAANESELPNVRMIFENLGEMAVNGKRKQHRAALFETM